VRVCLLLDRSVVPRGSGPVLPRRLSDVSMVWMWTSSSSHVYAVRYLYLRFVWFRPVRPSTSDCTVPMLVRFWRASHAALPLSSTDVWWLRGWAAYAWGRPLWGRSVLEHLDRLHPSDGGDGISRRRGPGALGNTRIASGRCCTPHVRIWGGAAVFLSNDHSQTTTVGAARGRVTFSAQP
jgi:hypothetical protein